MNVNRQGDAIHGDGSPECGCARDRDVIVSGGNGVQRTERGSDGSGVGEGDELAGRVCHDVGSCRRARMVPAVSLPLAAHRCHDGRVIGVGFLTRHCRKMRNVPRPIQELDASAANLANRLLWILRHMCHVRLLSR